MNPSILPRLPGPYIPRVKLSPPGGPKVEVRRHAALARIMGGSGSGTSLVLVQAPAGFGKTTLMRQLHADAASRGSRVAWLTLDDGDNDTARFLAGFAAAIEGICAPLAAAQSRPTRNADLSLWIMDRIATTEPPLLLFFDDVEALSNPVVVGLFALGVEAVPPGVTVVVGSRTLPAIGLARMRAHGKLLEIDADDLRFDMSEAAYLLAPRTGGTALSTLQLEHLNKRTEGWVTALWLASLALERQTDADEFLAAFSGSNAAIASYLAEDVLSRLPSTLREFALRASVLEELSLALCNAVCECEDSLDKLRALEHGNFFVSAANAEHDVYRFHSLFRDFLRNQLRQRGRDELSSLHLAACRAYLAQGRPIPAIRHALMSGDMTVTLPLLNQHLSELLNEGRVRLLADWLSQVPAHDLAEHPLLRVLHAWCVTFTRGPKEALALVAELERDQLPPESASYLLALRPMLLAMTDQIEQAHQVAKTSVDTIPAAYPFARAMLYQVLTQTGIILGDHDGAHQCVDEARRSQSEVQTVFGMVLAETAEATMDLLTGHLKQALTRMRLATQARSARSTRHCNGNAPAAILLAEALYESDQCEEALRLLQVYTPLVQDLGLPDALITAHVVLARIVDSRGEIDRALQVLAELEATGHRLALPRVLASARLERSQLYLAHDDEASAIDQLSLAERTCDWSSIESRWFVANDTLIPGIARQRWAIRRGQGAKIVATLRTQLAEAERQRRSRRALKLRILLAEALQADEQQKMALRTLMFAVRTAQSQGFVRTFLEESPKVQAMLKELLGQMSSSRESEFQHSLEIEQWLGRMTPKVAVSPVVKMLYDPLTTKELEVLSLLAQGNTNDALATKLFISDSTVRTHLRAINLKLHAGNRTQAIAIARELGMVP